MKRILLLESPGQLGSFLHWKERDGWKNQGSLVVPLCRPSGLGEYPLAKEYSYADPRELFDLAQQSVGLTRRLIGYFDARAECRHEGISLADCCYRELYYFVYALNRNLAYFRGLLEKEKPSEVRVMQACCPGGRSILPAPEEGFASRMMEKLCRERGVPCGTAAAPAAENARRRPQERLSFLFRTAKRALARLTQFKYAPRRESVLFVSKFPWIREECIREFRIGRRNVFLSSAHTGLGDLRNRAARWAILEDVSGPVGARDGSTLAPEQWFADARWKQMADGEPWAPYVVWRKAEIAAAFERARDRLRRAEFLYRRRRICRVVFDEDTCEYTRPLALTARRMKISSEVLAHGILAANTSVPGYLPLASDVIRCFDKGAADELVRAGLSPGRVRADEDFLTLPALRAEGWRRNERLRRQFLRRRGRYLALVLQHAFYGFHRGIPLRHAGEDENIRTLSDVIMLFRESREQFDSLVIKPHPGDIQRTDYERLCRLRGLSETEFEVVQKEDNLKLMFFAHAIVASFSTAIAEAVRMGKSVVGLDYSGLYRDHYLWKTPRVYRAQNMDELKSAMHRVFNAAPNPETGPCLTAR